MNILLLAADDAGGRRIQEMLRQVSSGHHTVKRVPTVQQALTELEHLGTQAIVVDLDLPGPEVCNSIEELHATDPALPIIALIRHSDSEMELEALRRGAQDVLGKDQMTGAALAKAIRYAVERQLLSQELRERDGQYRLIVETAQEGIWTIDERDRTVFVNRKMASLLGYTPAEMMGKTPLEFMDEESRAAAIPKLAAKRRGEVDHVDFRYLRKDGTPLWTTISTNPILDEKGQYRGAMALVTDITGRMKQEEALRRMAALVDSSADAIIGKDLEDRIVSWNRAAERLFGYSPAEAVGRSIRFLAPPERQIEIDGVVSRVRRGETVPAFDTVRTGKDGKPLSVSIAVSPIRDSAGKMTGSSAIIRDISDQKKLEAQFRQSQKMEAVGRLAGGVAHDFNNLLTVICGYTSLLLARSPEEAARQELEEVYRAGERAASLTRQLLAFSRKQILEPQVLELNPIITELEKMLRRLIGEDIRLTTSLQKDLGRVKVDPGQIEQVVMNLAVNARDAMPRGGRLIVETRNVDVEEGAVGAHMDIKPGSYVMLSVSDTGIGMDKEVQSHLFEPFFTTKGLGKGTGLGLSTIYGIVRQSGGHITVYSEPGKGSCFRVYLPNTTAKPQTAPAPGEPMKSLEGTEAILVVEDNEMVRKLTVEVLAKSGYRVAAFPSAEEALEHCSGHEFPDLLLTDMVLPGMDGLSFCRKAAQQKCGVKRMLMTGYTEEAVLLQGVSESGVPLLHKPFSPRALLTAVRGVLGRPAPASGLVSAGVLDSRSGPAIL